MTIEQQQVAIVVLAVVVALVVALMLAGGVVWYLVFKKGYTAIALMLLLPVVLLTISFFPIVWVIGASIQHILEAHEATNRTPGYELARAETCATVQKPHMAPVTAAPVTAAPATAEAKSEEGVRQSVAPAETKPAA